jgi:hypothetical protein
MHSSRLCTVTTPSPIYDRRRHRLPRALSLLAASRGPISGLSLFLGPPLYSCYRPSWPMQMNLRATHRWCPIPFGKTRRYSVTPNIIIPQAIVSFAFRILCSRYILPDTSSFHLQILSRTPYLARLRTWPLVNYKSVYCGICHFCTRGMEYNLCRPSMPIFG